MTTDVDTEANAPSEVGTSESSLINQAPGEANTEQGTSDTLTRNFVSLFYLIIVLVGAWSFGAQQFLREYWVGIVGVVIALFIVLNVPATRRWYKNTTTQRRIGTIIFSLIPVIGIFVVGVFLIPPKYQAVLLRTIFLVVVCSLPGILYYLFIATKKTSFLNEFIINLNHLGLLNPKRLPPDLVYAGLSEETKQERKNRIYTYIQTFESVYGAVPTSFSGQVLEPSDPGQSTVDPRIVNANTSGFAAFFTVDTTVPVIVATVLIVLGWLITLLPWEGQLVLRTQGAQSTEVVQQNQAEQQNNEVVLSSDAATQQWLSVSSPVTTPVRFAFIGPTFSHFSFYFVVTSAAISVRVHMLPYRYGLFWRSLEYGL